jgi:hypothetical protein
MFISIQPAMMLKIGEWKEMEEKKKRRDLLLVINKITN